VCSSPICSEEHLVFYHIFSEFFINIFEFLNFKTENGEKYQNFTFRLLAETKFSPKFRRNFAEKVNPGLLSHTRARKRVNLSTWCHAFLHEQTSHPFLLYFPFHWNDCCGPCFAAGFYGFFFLETTVAAKRVCVARVFFCFLFFCKRQGATATSKNAHARPYHNSNRPGRRAKCRQ